MDKLTMPHAIDLGRRRGKNYVGMSDVKVTRDMPELGVEGSDSDDGGTQQQMNSRSGGLEMLSMICTRLWIGNDDMTLLNVNS